MAKKKYSLTNIIWIVLTLLLNVFGIAFLVQGFVMQLTSGILYYGVLHYSLGVIFLILGMTTMKRCCPDKK